MNELLEDLSRALRDYKLFRLILEENNILFSETRSYTERYSLFPEEDSDWKDYAADRLAEMSRQYNNPDDPRFRTCRISFSSGRGTGSRSGGTMNV